MSALASRAFNLNGGHQPVTRKKAIVPKGPNSQSIQDHLQGLEIQPFIFALSAAIPDMEAETGNPIYQRRSARQQDNVQTIKALETSLRDTGYSSKGYPYWVHPHGPSVPQMRNIVEAAENCIDVLNDHRVSLKAAFKRADSSDRQERAQQQLDQFEKRYLAYSNGLHGITGLADQEQIIQMERDQVTKVQPGQMCALA
jgi:hypothetical protein